MEMANTFPGKTMPFVNNRVLETKNEWWLTKDVYNKHLISSRNVKVITTEPSNTTEATERKQKKNTTTTTTTKCNKIS